MRQKTSESLKPFLSILIVILTLFLVLTLKMEVRRLGYQVWQASQVEKKVRDEHRRMTAAVAGSMGPHRIHDFALNTMLLSEPKRGQVIQMTSLSEENH